MNEHAPTWYIIKQTSGVCQIMQSDDPALAMTDACEQWGPFATQGEAIARRVGLIRAGKCQPM